MAFNVSLHYPSRAWVREYVSSTGEPFVVVFLTAGNFDFPLYTTIAKAHAIAAIINKEELSNADA